MYCVILTVQPLVTPPLNKPKYLSIAFDYKHNPKNFRNLNLKNWYMENDFWFMENYLSYIFHIWKNAYHRGFIQFFVRMELYGFVW